jgi:hypothetical protein
MATVLVPWQGGCPHREAAWEWVRARYETTGWELIVSEQTGEWSKARAVMDAAPDCAEVVVIADADCWTDGIHAAVKAVQDSAEWACPFGQAHRLTPEATVEVLRDEVSPGGNCPTIQPPYRGLPGGGIVVARRDTLLAVPFDRRYVGWGRTDRSWRAAMRTMVGKPWRGNAPLYHLWHPPQSRPPRPHRHRAQDGRPGSPENEALYRLYLEAEGKPDQMRRLLDASVDSRRWKTGAVAQ